MSWLGRMFGSLSPAVSAPAAPVSPSLEAAILEYVGAGNKVARANVEVLRTGSNVVKAGFDKGLDLKQISVNVAQAEREAGLLEAVIAKRGEEEGMERAAGNAKDRLLYAAAFGFHECAFPLNKKGERTNYRYWVTLQVWQEMCSKAGLEPWLMPRGAWERAKEEADARREAEGKKRSSAEKEPRVAPPFEEARILLRLMFDEWNEKYSPEERKALLEEMGAIADNA